MVDETDRTTENRMKRFIIKNTSFSDWTVLSFIHSNLTTVNFQNFIDDLVYNWKGVEGEKKKEKKFD